MTELRSLLLFFILFFSLKSNAKPNSGPNASPKAKTYAEAKFARGTLKIAGKTLSVEIAETEDQHAQGLMFRKKLNENHGMIFIFTDSEIRRFWMKNTFIPLSIGYFDQNKTLVDIQDMQAMASVLEENPPAYPSSSPAQFALEVNQGWFKKNKIKLGSKFVLIRL